MPVKLASFEESKILTQTWQVYVCTTCDCKLKILLRQKWSEMNNSKSWYIEHSDVYKQPEKDARKFLEKHSLCK